MEKTCLFNGDFAFPIECEYVQFFSLKSQAKIIGGQYDGATFYGIDGVGDLEFYEWSRGKKAIIDKTRFYAENNKRKVKL